MNKETIKEYAIVILLIFFVVYLMGSFVAASFNIMLWEAGGRAAAILLTAMGILAYVGTTNKW